MEILGVGGAELVAILIIMLIVAGPKRMIQWAYILGQYVSKLRAMWSESMGYIQQEFKQAGLDIELPKEPPTRGSLNRQITKALTPVTKPVQDALDEANLQTEQIKKNVKLTPADTNGHKVAPQKQSTTTSQDKPESNLGTWSGGEKIDE